MDLALNNLQKLIRHKTKQKKEKTWRQLDENAAWNIDHVMEATHNKWAAIRPPSTHYENYQS